MWVATGATEPLCEAVVDLVGGGGAAAGIADPLDDSTPEAGAGGFEVHVVVVRCGADGAEATGGGGAAGPLPWRTPEDGDAGGAAAAVAAAAAKIGVEDEVGSGA